MADSYGRLTYAFDGGFLSGAQPPPDTPPTSDDVDDYSTNSENTDSSSNRREDSKNRSWSDLSASIRMLSDSYLKMELAELEMMKAREASRIEAERRRMESETELTQMMLNTQLEMASFLARNSRKRKREGKEEEEEDDDDSSATESRKENLPKDITSAGRKYKSLVFEPHVKPRRNKEPMNPEGPEAREY